MWNGGPGKLLALFCTPDDFLDGFNHVQNLPYAHSRIQRQRHQPWVELEGDRAVVVRKVCVSSEETQQRNRDEVNARADVPLPQFIDELRPRDCQRLEVQPQCVQMP